MDPIDLRHTEDAAHMASVECRGLAEYFDRLERHLRARQLPAAEGAAHAIIHSLHRLHCAIDEMGSLLNCFEGRGAA